MILVTGGTGLGSTFIAVFDRIRKSRVEKYAQFIEIRQLSKKQSPYLSFMTNYPCLL
jgi:hypothetical protein